MGQGGFSDYMSFRTMISTAWIKIIYAVGAIAITVASVVALATGSRQFGGSSVVSGLVGFVAGNIIWRMICESAILFFSMHEQLVSLVQLSHSQARASSGAPLAAIPVADLTASHAAATGASHDGATVVCRWCGERTPASGASCRFCRRPLQADTPPGAECAPQSADPSGGPAATFCPNCGAELAPGTIHHRCWKCDTPLR